MKLTSTLRSLCATFLFIALGHHAQAADADLILGFNQPATSLTGFSSNLLVNLGRLADFDTNYTKTVSNGYTTYSLGNLGGLLTGLYNTDWGALQYGVFGGTFGASTYSVWGTRRHMGSTARFGQQDANTPAFSVFSAAAKTKTSNLYAASYQTSGGFTYAVTDRTADGSWAKNFPSGISIPAASMSSIFQNVITDGNYSYSLADLWVASDTGRSFLGTLNISDAADLSFTTAQVIPEPSSYAMIVGGLTVGFVALRRRFSKAV